jgi:hypothetical protein
MISALPLPPAICLFWPPPPKEEEEEEEEEVVVVVVAFAPLLLRTSPRDVMNQSGARSMGTKLDMKAQMTSALAEPPVVQR